MVDCVCVCVCVCPDTGVSIYFSKELTMSKSNQMLIRL